MEWTARRMDRLYQLYQRHIDRLRKDVIQANRSLGSSQPERTHLDHLSRSEFETLLQQPTDDPDVTRLWVRRIVRGHEHEFRNGNSF
jgi:hypothetical protein